MITRKSGGFMEFIPNPQEKRDGLIRNHVFNLLANLDVRLAIIEKSLGLSDKRSREFNRIIDHIKQEEIQNLDINDKLSATGG